MGGVLRQLLGGDVSVERVHPDAVGEITLELRRGARQDDQAPRLRTAGELAEQPCLADAGLALDGETRGRPGLEGFDGGVDLTELMPPSDERTGAGCRVRVASIRPPDGAREDRGRVQGAPLM